MDVQSLTPPCASSSEWALQQEIAKIHHSFHTAIAATVDYKELFLVDNASRQVTWIRFVEDGEFGHYEVFVFDYDVLNAIPDSTPLETETFFDYIIQNSSRFCIPCGSEEFFDVYRKFLYGIQKPHEIFAVLKDRKYGSMGALIRYAWEDRRE